MNIAALLVVATSVVVLFPTFRRYYSLGSVVPSAAGGLVSLGMLRLLAFFGVPMIAANPFTVSIAATSGIPGVVSMLLMRLFIIA